MDSIPHPFYSHMNMATTSMHSFHFIIPLFVLLVWLVYWLYIVPLYDMTATTMGYALVQIGKVLVSVTLVSYILLLIQKPRIKEPMAEDGEKSKAIARAQEAAENNWHCYDIDYPIRYCWYCKKFIPHRCFHCAECGECVELKDHHCDFFGFCIGRHNILFFALFFCSLFVASLYGIVCFFHFLTYSGVCTLYIDTNSNVDTINNTTRCYKDARRPLSRWIHNGWAYPVCLIPLDKFIHTQTQTYSV